MNPYSPPTSSAPDSIQPRRSATPILVGAAVGTGAAYAVLFLCGLIFLWVLAAHGVPTQELYARAYESTGYLMFAHFVGLLCAAPGGYWSARLSSSKPYASALAAGILVAVFSLAQNFIPYSLPIPLWSRIASIIIPVPGFLLGAYWYYRAA